MKMTVQQNFHAAGHLALFRVIGQVSHATLGDRVPDAEHPGCSAARRAHAFPERAGGIDHVVSYPGAARLGREEVEQDVPTPVARRLKPGPRWEGAGWRRRPG
jgi:hypothetical protein